MNPIEAFEVRLKDMERTLVNAVKTAIWRDQIDVACSRLKDTDSGNAGLYAKIQEMLLR